MSESVWDYPRPPALEPCTRRVRIELGGVTVADSTAALRVLETSHPPTIYVPPADVAAECLRAGAGRSLCEWKGIATYFDVAAAASRRSPAATSKYVAMPFHSHSERPAPARRHSAATSAGGT